MTRTFPPKSLCSYRQTELAGQLSRTAAGSAAGVADPAVATPVIVRKKAAPIPESAAKRDRSDDICYYSLAVGGNAEASLRPRPGRIRWHISQSRVPRGPPGWHDAQSGPGAGQQAGDGRGEDPDSLRRAGIDRGRL